MYAWPLVWTAVRGSTLSGHPIWFRMQPAAPWNRLGCNCALPRVVTAVITKSTSLVPTPQVCWYNYSKIQAASKTAVQQQHVATKAAKDVADEESVTLLDRKNASVA